jgi:alpha-tubulin suppressor-like RCC1 family protein
MTPTPTPTPTKVIVRRLIGAGRNNSGQLGLGDFNSRNTFAILSQAITPSQIVCGYANTFLRSSVGNTNAWAGAGFNQQGQLGIGSTINQSSFVGIGSSWTNIVASNHTFGRNVNGDWYGCGLNSSGQLGLGTNDNNYFTLFTNSGTNIIIAQGQFRPSVLAAGGEFSIGNIASAEGAFNPAASTGRNNVGQLGLGNTTDTNVFAGPLGGLQNPFQIPVLEAGNAFTFGFFETVSNYRSWGSNSHGQLGQGTTIGGFVTAPGIIQPSGLQLETIVCGFTHVVGKRTGTREWYACGSNASYELGLGDTANRNIFTRIPGEWDAMRCGRNFTLGQRDGDWYCVGANTYGQFGFGNTTTITNWTLLPSNYTFGAGKDWYLLDVGLDHIVGYRDIEIVQA